MARPNPTNRSPRREQQREIRGKQYRLVVLRVTGWDSEGRPSQATIGYDDTSFDLRDDKVSREFLTAYVSVEGTTPQSKSKH